MWRDTTPQAPEGLLEPLFLIPSHEKTLCVVCSGTGTLIQTFTRSISAYIHNFCLETETLAVKKVSTGMKILYDKDYMLFAKDLRNRLLPGPLLTPNPNPHPHPTYSRPFVFNNCCCFTCRNSWNIIVGLFLLPVKSWTMLMGDEHEMDSCWQGFTFEHRYEWIHVVCLIMCNIFRNSLTEIVSVWAIHRFLDQGHCEWLF